MSEWKPIETIPKDGTLVLCGCFKTSKGSEDKFGVMEVDRWRAEYNAPGAFNNRHWPATHWMPLPAPPKQGKDK